MYTFITATENQDPNQPKSYLAVSSEEIKSLVYAETFGDYGQKVGAYTAGNYIELLSGKARSIATEVAEDLDVEMREKNQILAYSDDSELYEKVAERLEKECDAAEFEHWQGEVEGLTYWDGHNFQTIITGCGDYDFRLYWEKVEDETLIKELNEAIEGREFLKEGFGREIYESEKHWIEDNYCEGHFESFAVYPKSEVELDEI